MDKVPGFLGTPSGAPGCTSDGLPTQTPAGILPHAIPSSGPPFLPSGRPHVPSAILETSVPTQLQHLSQPQQQFTANQPQNFACLANIFHGTSDFTQPQPQIRQPPTFPTSSAPPPYFSSGGSRPPVIPNMSTSMQFSQQLGQHETQPSQLLSLSPMASTSSPMQATLQRLLMCSSVVSPTSFSAFSMSQPSSMPMLASASIQPLLSGPLAGALPASSNNLGQYDASGLAVQQSQGAGQDDDSKGEDEGDSEASSVKAEGKDSQLGGAGASSAHSASTSRSREGRTYQPKKCEHGRQKNKCVECRGAGICEHNRLRRICKLCGGNGICEHNRQRNICRDCKGSQICEHLRRRSRCKDCGGGQICPHGRRRSRCKECKGTEVCQHQRERRLCMDCRGSGICEHLRQRRFCKECKGGDDVVSPSAGGADRAAAAGPG